LKYSLDSDVRCFIFFSSVGVMGTTPDPLPGKPGNPYRGDTLYHRSKIEAEKRVLKYIADGYDAYILRPAITYGEGDNGFPHRLAQMLRKGTLPLPSRDIKIHLLNVSSIAGVVLALLGSTHLDQKIFVLADAKPVSLVYLANRIYSYFHGVPYPRTRRIPSFLLEVIGSMLREMGEDKWSTRFLLLSKDWYYDISDAERMLSFTPSVTEESFIRLVCEYDGNNKEK
jgi:nucleoside-diphosphate-sugar epimerase